MSFRPFLPMLFLFFFQCQNIKKEGEKTVEEKPPVLVKDIPPLSYLDMMGQKHLANALEGKVILVLFQPDCDHCTREAEEMRKNLEYFKNYKLCFISSAEIPQIREFAQSFGFLGQPNFSFGQTSVEEVLKHFGPIPTPSLYIYSEEGKLLQTFKGETPIDHILSKL